MLIIEIQIIYIYKLKKIYEKNSDLKKIILKINMINLKKNLKLK